MLHTNLYGLVVIKFTQLCVYVKPKLEYINASELLNAPLFWHQRQKKPPFFHHF